MKDGKVVMVGVDLPPKPAQQPATN
jgi:hypothetical protein